MSIEEEVTPGVTVHEPITLHYPGMRIVIPSEGHPLKINGGFVDLAPMPSRLLQVLAEHLGEIISPARLTELLYGPDAGKDAHLVDVHVCRIRETLTLYSPDKKVLTTHWNRGFKLASPTGELPPVVGTFVHGAATLTVDVNNTVYVNEVVVPFTPQEFRLFEMLRNTPGEVWSKQRIYETMYSGNRRPELKIIDVVKCKVSKKLMAAHPDLSEVVRRVWGRGYVFGEPKSTANDALEEEFERVPFVLRQGMRYSLANLPDPSANVRWVVSRKAVAVWLIEGRALSVNELLARYPGLTRFEFERWQRDVRHGGPQRLRVTRFDVDAA